MNTIYPIRLCHKLGASFGGPGCKVVLQGLSEGLTHFRQLYRLWPWNGFMRDSSYSILWAVMGPIYIQSVLWNQPYLMFVFLPAIVQADG